MHNFFYLKVRRFVAVISPGGILKSSGKFVQSFRPVELHFY